MVKAGRSRFTLQTLAGGGLPAAGQAQPARRRRFTLPQKALRRLLGAGAVRHGAAGHPLLPERPADGGRGGAAEAGRDRRPSARVRHRCKLGGGPAARRKSSCRARPCSSSPSCSPTATTRCASSSPPPRRRFSFGSIELVSKLVDGKFPDYTRVIPTQHKNRLQIEREPLRQALQRAAILSNEKFRGVRWVLTEAA